MDTGLKKFNKLIITKIVAVILCLISVGAMTMQVCSSFAKSYNDELSFNNYSDALKRGILGIEKDLWLFDSFNQEYENFYTVLSHMISTYGDGSEETFKAIKDVVENNHSKTVEMAKKNLISAASADTMYFLSALYEKDIDVVGSLLTDNLDEENTEEYYHWVFSGYIDYSSVSDENFNYFNGKNECPDYVKESFKDLDYDGIFFNSRDITIFDDDDTEYTKTLGEYACGYYAFKLDTDVFADKVLEYNSEEYFSVYGEFFSAYKSYRNQLENNYPSAKYFVRDNNGNTYTNISSLSSGSTDEDIKKVFSSYGTYSYSDSSGTYLNNGRVFSGSFDSYASFIKDSYEYFEAYEASTTLHNTVTEETTYDISVPVPSTTVIAIPETTLKNSESVSVPVTAAPTSVSYNNKTPFSSVVSASTYECYVGIDTGVKSDTCNFADIIYKVEIAEDIIRECFTVCAALSVLVILCMIYLILKTGKNEEGEIRLSKTDKMFIEIRILIDAAVCAVGVFGILILLGPLVDSEMHSFILILIGILAAIVFAFLLDAVLFLVRNIKNGSVLKNNSLVWLGARCLRYLKKSASVLKEKLLYTKELKKTVFIRTAIVIGINILIGIIAFICVADNSIRAGFFITVMLFLFDLYIVYKGLLFTAGTDRLFDFVKEMRNGNLDININKNNLPSYLSLPAENLQCLSEGMKEAVNEAVRQEKTKTELITNVSHDLKTPLTSIINYVDLLKKCDISDETALSYLQVLSEKSDRLKILIEDLVEASKASAGALNVNFVSVSLKELLNQLLGEFEESFEEKGLSTILNIPDEEIIIRADSKHIYRVMENLFVNIRKYALENTRVYITLSQKKGKGIVNIKNISAAPLNISADELKERFVRGEQSRTTEGNGLGLSIAENLCKIQNGTLNIEINGDLFSVTVEMEKA